MRRVCITFRPRSRIPVVTLGLCVGAPLRAHAPRELAPRLSHADTTGGMRGHTLPERYNPRSSPPPLSSSHIPHRHHSTLTPAQYSTLTGDTRCHALSLSRTYPRNTTPTAFPPPILHPRARPSPAARAATPCRRTPCGTTPPRGGSPAPHRRWRPPPEPSARCAAWPPWRLAARCRGGPAPSPAGLQGAQLNQITQRLDLHASCSAT